MVSTSEPAWTMLALVLSYALGSFPGSRLVARRHGVDLSRTGDGNPGAWNVLRELGWARAWPAFVVDGLKGLLAATLGWVVLGSGPLGAAGDPAPASPAVDWLPWSGALALGLDAWLPWACVGAAMLGHAYPLAWRGGRGPRIARGGKSVMTFAGGMLALVPVVCVPLFVVFVVGAARGAAGRAARVVVGGVPFAQALVTPLAQVGWTGMLMTLIGALFLLERLRPRRS